jgi:hypothetical protein
MEDYIGNSAEQNLGKGDDRMTIPLQNIGENSMRREKEV